MQRQKSQFNKIDSLETISPNRYKITLLIRIAVTEVTGKRSGQQAKQ